MLAFTFIASSWQSLVSPGFQWQDYQHSNGFKTVFLSWEIQISLCGHSRAYLAI